VRQCNWRPNSALSSAGQSAPSTWPAGCHNFFHLFLKERQPPVWSGLRERKNPAFSESRDRAWAKALWLRGGVAKATGDCGKAQEYFGCPAAMRKHTLWASRMSAGKNILVANSLRLSAPGASPFLPVLMGHFSRAPLVIFRKCRRGCGSSLTSNQHCPHPPMMIRRLAERQ
jgi:hypothetical protein